MRTNDRVREKIAPDLDSGETVQAVINMADTSAVGWVSSGGVVHSGGSTLPSEYLQRHGLLDPWDGTQRPDLANSWCAITTDHLRFYAASNTSLRPTPGKPIDTFPLAGTTLRWFDESSMTGTSRLLHFTLPDGRRIITTTLVKAKLRRKTPNDELELFIRAFGDAATQVSAAD